jgi:gas vesicle protein
VRRNWFIWAIVVGVASIAIAALIMRLTADDESNPTTTEWADSVCTSFATWKTSIESLADVSSGSLDAEVLQQKVDDAQAATSTLVTELKDLGAPDLEAGDELQQELSSSADEIQSSVDTLKQGAEQAADAGSPTEFLQELAALAPQFQALFDQISAAITGLQDANVSDDAKAELQTAFADAGSCQQLQADG